MLLNVSNVGYNSFISNKIIIRIKLDVLQSLLTDVIKFGILLESATNYYFGEMEKLS